MDQRRVIGVAAPPGLHGVEAVLVEVTGQAPRLHVEVLHTRTEPFPRELRDLLIRVSSPETADARQIAVADRWLGEALAGAARNLADSASVSLHSVLCLGCHGFPAWQETQGKTPVGLGLGSASVLAERTGLTVVADFAGRDLACGGCGGPLAPLVDALLFRHADEARLVLHLGGLTQVTVLPPEGDPAGILGWQAGPGQVLLDALVHVLTRGKEREDAGGRYAVQGRHLPELLERWLLHPFVVSRPPKAAARALFAEVFARQTMALAQQRGWNANDLLCTATHFVARCVVESLGRYLPRPIRPMRAILTGPGVRNGLLWHLLQEHLPEVTLERSDAFGIPAELKEAVDAAVLACLFLDQEPANLANVTGARGVRVLGNLTPGSTSNWSRCLAWLTGRRDLFLEED